MADCFAETRATPRSTPSMAAGGRRRSLHDHTVDPALNDRRVKEEPLSRSTTPLSNFSFDQTGLHRAYAPPMQDWRTGPYAQMPMKKEESIDPPSDESFRPATRRPARRRRRQSISAISLSDNDEDIYGTISDASKLKGVYWPGMAMFDSATPDMRRKRNQKKAISVVQQLEATSKVVEATEMVRWLFQSLLVCSAIHCERQLPMLRRSRLSDYHIAAVLLCRVLRERLHFTASRIALPEACHLVSVSVYFQDHRTDWSIGFQRDLGVQEETQYLELARQR